MSNSNGSLSCSSKQFNSNKVINELLEDASKKIGYKFKATKVTGGVSTKKKHQSKKSRTNKVKQDVQVNESSAAPLPNKHNETNKGLIFPHVTASNWQKFERKLQKKEIDEVTKKLDACLARMHGFEVYDTHFTSLHFVRLAIVDSLLKRKWDNLVRLVVMLSRNYINPVFRMFIRHLCQILKQYHPAIRGTEFEDQIDLIVEKYEGGREKRNNTKNLV